MRVTAFSMIRSSRGGAGGGSGLSDGGPRGERANSVGGGMTGPAALGAVAVALLPSRGADGPPAAAETSHE